MRIAALLFVASLLAAGSASALENLGVIGGIERANMARGYGVDIDEAAGHGTFVASIIAIAAPTGIGRMYGPIRPVTNAIGSSAAITVKVARMVGPPTSSTAGGIASNKVLSPIAMCR